MNNQLDFYLSIETNVFQGREKRFFRKNIKKYQKYQKYPGNGSTRFDRQKYDIGFQAGRLAVPQGKENPREILRGPSLHQAIFFLVFPGGEQIVFFESVGKMVPVGKAGAFRDFLYAFIRLTQKISGIFQSFFLNIKFR